jgi:dGTPase
MTEKAGQMVASLFDHYMSDPTQMPEEFRASTARGDKLAQARVVADYVAGMTDRYAIAEFERLG